MIEHLRVREQVLVQVTAGCERPRNRLHCVADKRNQEEHERAEWPRRQPLEPPEQQPDAARLLAISGDAGDGS